MPARRQLLIPIVLVFMTSSLLGGLWIKQQPGGQTTWGSAPPAVQSVMWPEPRSLSEFSLKTQHGDSFGPESFQGRWSFVFFGYTACPDVCPMSLHAMRGMKQFLDDQPSTDRLQFVFVSVDPENDTPQDMREYLSWYDDEFIGLHGAIEQIDRLAGSMAVKHEEFIDETGYRSIDHTSSVMIIDPRGRVVGALPPPLEPQRMTEQFERLRGFLARNRI